MYMENYTLSSTSGARIAKIKGGRYDGKVIYLYDKNFKCCLPCDKLCGGNCCDQCSKIDYKNKKKDVADIDEITLDDEGEFILEPTNILNQRSVFHITGRTGCGKSVLASQILKEYRHYFPNNRVILFSMKKSDENLDPYIDKRVNLDKYLEAGGLTEADFKPNQMLVFDDIDVLPQTKQNPLRSAIFALLSQIIQISRSKNISVIQTSHLPTSGNETRAVLGSMTNFVFFPAAVSHQVKQALHLYCGLSIKQIKYISSLKNTRWVSVNMSVPQVIITQKQIFFLKSE